MWAANVEHLFPEHDWTVLVQRMLDHPTSPDIVFLSEVDRAEADRFVSVLGNAAGTDYSFSHSATGNNAVAWRTTRFGDSPLGDPLLWEPYGAAGCSKPSQNDPSEVIGVSLEEEQSGTEVVAVAVHWGRTWAAECMEKNLSALDSLIEKTWDDRPLTIVAGDLNAHPDKQPVPGRPHDEDLDSGRETDPDCWYRALSASHDQTLEHDRPEEDDRDCSNDPYYSAPADSYYDTVAVVNEGDRLCDHWTSVHGGPVPDGSSCTDKNGDGLRDRGRIDFVWVRWEGPTGDALDLSETEARALVQSAGADQICILDSCSRTRYSDHRAVFAEIALDPDS